MRAFEGIEKLDIRFLTFYDGPEFGTGDSRSAEGSGVMSGPFVCLSFTETLSTRESIHDRRNNAFLLCHKRALA